MSFVSISGSGCKIIYVPLQVSKHLFADRYTASLELVDVNRPIVVTRLTYSHIPKATQTWLGAFADDPVIRYARETPDYKGDRSVIGKAIEKAIHQLLIGLWIRTKIARTVNKGAAVIIATYAENSQEGRNRKPSDRFFDFVTQSLFRGLELLGTPKQRKRREEISTKVTAVVEKAIGNRTKDMLYVDGLATAPAEQCRGYGGAVLDSVTEEADAQGRATWLMSSNIINTEFYDSHGFVTVGTYILGDKNPEWHETPVIVNIMVREPRKSNVPERSRMKKDYYLRPA